MQVGLSSYIYTYIRRRRRRRRRHTRRLWGGGLLFYYYYYYYHFLCSTNPRFPFSSVSSVSSVSLSSLLASADQKHRIRPCSPNKSPKASPHPPPPPSPHLLVHHTTPHRISSGGSSAAARLCSTDPPIHNNNPSLESWSLACPCSHYMGAVPHTPQTPYKLYTFMCSSLLRVAREIARARLFRVKRPFCSN